MHFYKLIDLPYIFFCFKKSKILHKKIEKYSIIECQLILSVSI